MFVAGYQFKVLSPVFTGHWGLQTRKTRPAWRERQNSANRKHFETFKKEVFARYMRDPLKMMKNTHWRKVRRRFRWLIARSWSPSFTLVARATHRTDADPWSSQGWWCGLWFFYLTCLCHNVQKTLQTAGTNIRTYRRRSNRLTVLFFTPSNRRPNRFLYIFCISCRDLHNVRLQH